VGYPMPYGKRLVLGMLIIELRQLSPQLNIQKTRLKIFIKMGTKEVEDPLNICKPIPEKYGYGLLNTQFELSRKEDLDYAMKLIIQAYNYVSGKIMKLNNFYFNSQETKIDESS